MHIKSTTLLYSSFCILTTLLLAYILPFPKTERTQTPPYALTDLAFPRGFLWGASTSAHQVEGSTNNDWTLWEEQHATRLAAEADAKFSHTPRWNQFQAQAAEPANYRSGKAADHLNRYPEDIQLMKQLGLTAYRFSVEWSRIEPRDGEFDAAALAHYQTLAASLKTAGIEPFVTLWHRTQPTWVAKQGEWTNDKTIADFVRYAGKVAEALGPTVRYYMTFNEPELHIGGGYVQGVIPPEQKSLALGNEAFSRMTQAHRDAHAAIHAANPAAQVGSTHAMQLGQASPATTVNTLAQKYLDGFANWKFVDNTLAVTDFIGIQYYGPTQYQVTLGGTGLINVQNSPDPHAPIKSDMGWEVYPHGIYELIMKTAERYSKPIYITENGIADAQDTLRAQYIADHLYWVQQARERGADVRGYFVWSLLDNFEWDKGFWPRFGLVAVDYANNQQRTIRPSAWTYRQIIANTQK